MSSIISDEVKEFRERLKDLSRDELLEIIKEQNPKYIKQIDKIEYVFKYKLRHLTWDDGTPVKGRNLSNEELALLIDPPFMYSRELAREGLNEDAQRQIHIASDPVLWAKYFLRDRPRVYQVLVLRNPHHRKVMRFGRRMGKTHTFALFALWYAYTNNEARIIIVAPMKSHVGLIYEAVLALAKQNETILPNDDSKQGSIVRYVQSPQFEIKFENDSIIRFFTTGMKSNGRADVARGQEADVLILDEMDYMGKDDLIALLAMLQTTNEAKHTKKILLGASTPTGQRNTFWDWNTNPQANFAAFWFPSYVNPGWKQEDEDQMRVDYPDEQAYKHEVEADWGEDSEGVYPHKYLKLAFQDDDPIHPEVIQGGWKYEESVTSANAFYVIGIDWDKYGAGVNVVVLEICGQNYENTDYAGKIRLIYREEIRKGEFTYTAAVDRIIRLNEVFHPTHIYADRGAGEVQIELLHKYGMEHRESKLHKIVKGWQFAETIEVRDPFTQQMVKKDLKPFMVGNLQRLLESQHIFFPAHDEEMYLQLMSYVIVRTGSTGRPVFGAGGNAVDHAHDALILACFAIADNYDELLNPIFATRAIPISNAAFLPTLTIDNEKDAQIAEDTWGKGKGPVQQRRAMTYNLRGSARGNMAPIRRKMF